LRGQYTHNHQVFNNQAPHGGFPKLFETGREDSTLAVWLEAAGYRTALIGKYMNAYPLADDRTYVPPGWSEWYSPGRKNAYDGYDYYLNENGVLVPYPPTEENFFTDVMSRKGVDFIQRAVEDDTPFFLLLSSFAPHEPAAAARRHENLLPGISAPRTPSFNEADVSDKSPEMRSNPLLTEEQFADIDKTYRERVLSMLSVDEMIAEIFKVLEENDILENTYVIFTSDQGFTLGQHRIVEGKSSFYEEDIVVPFVVRGPGIPEGETISGLLTGMIDLAPTFSEWAGVVPPFFVDGRSFAGTLTSGTIPADWRTGFLLEMYSFGGQEEGRGLPTVFASILSLPFEQRESLPKSIGVRTLNRLYWERPDGFVELYDLDNDPYQLENMAALADPVLLAEFSAWLKEFDACQGQTCRLADMKPHP
jgi:N-acetylglucosamine-6-sulfatase